MLRRSILLASVVVLISTACGGEDRAQTLEEEPTEAPAEQAAVTDEAALRQALLTIEDLPTGWTTAPEDEDETNDGPAPCDMEPVQEETTSVEEHFQKGELEDQLMVGVAAYDSVRGAESALQEFRTHLQDCREWEDTDDEGTHLAWTLAPLSFPNLGEETIAFRVAADITGGEEGFELSASVVGDFIVIRKANLISAIFHAGFGLFGPAEIDSEQTESLARKADEKLAGVVG